MKSRPKTPYQAILINRLGKVTMDPILQGAGPVDIVRIGGNEDGRNRVPRLDEMFVELDSGHRRHVDVGDQARGLGEAR